MYTFIYKKKSGPDAQHNYYSIYTQNGERLAMTSWELDELRANAFIKLVCVAPIAFEACLALDQAQNDADLEKARALARAAIAGTLDPS